MARPRRPILSPEDKKPRPPAPVTVRTVNSQAWRAALYLAGGDHRRLERLSENEVLVRNPR